MMVGVMAVDPGTTTGVARTLIDVPWTDGNGWANLAAGKISSWEIEGEASETSWEVMGEFRDWAIAVAVPCYLFCEGFQLRTFNQKPSLLDPVRIGAGMEVLAWTRAGERWCHIQWTSASSAKGYATDVRLRAAGLWVRGSAHRRDAVRHLAYACQRIQQGKQGPAARPISQ